MMSNHLCDVRGIRALVHQDSSVKNVCGGKKKEKQLSEKGKKGRHRCNNPALSKAFMEEEEVYVPEAGSVLRC